MWEKWGSKFKPVGIFSYSSGKKVVHFDLDKNPDDIWNLVIVFSSLTPYNYAPKLLLHVFQDSTIERFDK